MKSVQRKFGGFMKRSDNEADVQGVLEQFKAVDDMLDRVRAVHCHVWYSMS
jgi:amphiphysin